MHPYSAKVLRLNKINKVLVYRNQAKGEGDFLSRSYLFDSVGNLIKSSLYSYSGIEISSDTLIYDSLHRLSRMRSAGKDRQTYHKGNYTQTDDSSTLIVDQLSVNGTVEILVSERHTNNKGQLVRLINFGKDAQEVEYYYQSDGLPKRRLSYKEGVLVGQYDYYYTYRKKGKELSLKFMAGNKQRVELVCTYNKKNQCTKCNYPAFGLTSIFQYNEEGLIRRHIEISKKYQIIEKYVYSDFLTTDK
jgi:hypothetical protein